MSGGAAHGCSPTPAMSPRQPPLTANPVACWIGHCRSYAPCHFASLCVGWVGGRVLWGVCIAGCPVCSGSRLCTRPCPRVTLPCTCTPTWWCDWCRWAPTATCSLLGTPATPSTTPSHAHRWVGLIPCVTHSLQVTVRTRLCRSSPCPDCIQAVC